MQAQIDQQALQLKVCDEKIAQQASQVVNLEQKLIQKSDLEN